VNKVYISGPIRTDSMLGWMANILKAYAVARMYWKKGSVVVCPHTNTAFMDRRDLPPRVFLTGDLELVGWANLVVMLPNWDRSTGCVGEHDRAVRSGKEIHYLTRGQVQEAIDDLLWGSEEAPLSGEKDGLEMPTMWKREGDAGSP